MAPLAHAQPRSEGRLAMGAPTSAAISCPILIGRSAALEALRSVLETTRGGHGQMLLIAGEAGVGKSRLVAEARAYGADSGFLTLQGHCFEQDIARSLCAAG